MGLTIRKLLTEYFSKEEVQDALRDIGELTSGTKDELVNRLANNWESYNRDVYDLLNFTDEAYLQMICYHYNLDDTEANKQTLIRRIKKANLLEKTMKKNSIKNNVIKNVESKNYELPEIKELTREVTHSSSEHKISRKTLRWTIVGSIATVIGVIISIILALK